MEKIGAIILAGGFGTRTQGVLKDIPKTLVITSDGKSILHHALEDLIDNCKFNKIYIVSNSLHYHSILQHVKKIYPNKDIFIFDNGKKNSEERLGALGDLLFAFNNIRDNQRSYLVVPCDNTYWRSFSLKQFLDFSLKNNNDFTMVVRDVKDLKIIKGRFGCAVLDKNNSIVQFIEKPNVPPSTFAATPFYIYRKEHIRILEEYIKQGKAPDHPGSFIPYLIEKGNSVKAFIVKDLLIDAGTPDDIDKAKKY